MTYYQHSKPYKGYVTEVHIADIHFGCIDPETEYNILMEQFINRIALIDFDILSIDGDLFDKKFLANSQAVYYAIQFMNECVSLCIQKNTGTYWYKEISGIPFRIPDIFGGEGGIW